MELQNYVEESKLNLASKDLIDVPIAEIIKIENICHLDLSRNILTQLSSNFAINLSHISKLDLSNNMLIELPSNFGQMRSLKHLDVFNNQLPDLPVGMCDLINLKYVDLRNNPLNDDLKQILGDFSNTSDCYSAAKRVTDYLKALRLEEEREFSFRIIEKDKTDVAKEKLEIFKLKEKLLKLKKEKKLKDKELKMMQNLKERKLNVQNNESHLKNGFQDKKKENNTEKLLFRQNTVTSEISTTGLLKNGHHAKKEKESTFKNEEKSNNSKKTEKWTLFGIINLFLLLLVMVLGICFAVNVVFSNESAEDALTQLHKTSKKFLNSPMNFFNLVSSKSKEFFVTLVSKFGEFGEWIENIKIEFCKSLQAQVLKIKSEVVPYVLTMQERTSLFIFDTFNYICSAVKSNYNKLYPFLENLQGYFQDICIKISDNLLVLKPHFKSAQENFFEHLVKPLVEISTTFYQAILMTIHDISKNSMFISISKEFKTQMRSLSYFILDQIIVFKKIVSDDIIPAIVHNSYMLFQNWYPVFKGGISKFYFWGKNSTIGY